METFKNKVDLTHLKPTTTYTQAYRLCKRVKEEGYRAACIPSKFLETLKENFSDITISTAVNYPYGLHGADVVLREVQGVIGVCEDLTNLEIEVVSPRDLHQNWDLFAEWNILASIKLIVTCSDAYRLKEIPITKYKVADAFTIIKTDSTPMAKVVRALRFIKELGYKTKIAGSLSKNEILPYLKDIDMIGTSNLYLF